MATAPLARAVVTIVGSISGVRPTATEMANRKASSQLPFVKPLINSTTGTITSIKRISTQETEFTPFSKLVWTGFTVKPWAIVPKNVSSPVPMTTQVAAPITTVLPIKARL